MLTKLHDAAGHGYKDAVSLLVQRGADMRAKDFRGDTPLYEAISRNPGHLICIFADCGMKLDECDEDGWTMLHRAAWFGADVGSLNNSDISPFDIALNRGNEEITQL